MKLFVKIAVLLITLMLGISILFSCSKEDSSDIFVGTWKRQIGDYYRVLEFKSNKTGCDYCLMPIDDKYSKYLSEQYYTIESERHFTYVHTDKNVVVDNDAVVYFIDGDVLYKDNEPYRKSK